MGTIMHCNSHIKTATAALPQRGLGGRTEGVLLHADKTHKHKYTEKESFPLQPEAEFPIQGPRAKAHLKCFSDTCRHLGTRPWLLLVSMASSFNTEKASQAFKDFYIIGLHWFNNCVFLSQKETLDVIHPRTLGEGEEGRLPRIPRICQTFPKKGKASSILSISPSSLV